MDDDAWDWGGEPGSEPAGADWFAHPLAASPAPAAAERPEERAARTLDELAARLRAGALTLDSRAAIDSEEAVLATVLAALFARRVR